MNSIIFVICYITGAVDSGGYFTDLITKGLGLAGQSENPAHKVYNSKVSKQRKEHIQKHLCTKK